MGDPRGFIKSKRKSCEYRPVCERVKDYKEVFLIRTDGQSKEQASRCMDCGTPFCNWACPLGNYIPEWNDLMFNGQWKNAFELLEENNILPEVTGRVCPAVCEYACVLGINDDPVTIRENELAIIEHAFRNGWVKPKPPKKRTGKKVAVIGSGPAGLACAVELNRMGHKVVVFEKDDKIGGIMRYGIPDFKLEKKILDRRIEIWKKEGIEFRTGVNVSSIPKGFDAVCLAKGAREPRDLKIPGRNLKGIYFAMDYLSGNVNANGKRVVVIGGGDTGSDCVGTANRQGVKCVVQIELLPKPSKERPENQPWPTYPFILKTSPSHEEGCERKWVVMTKEFVGTQNSVSVLKCVKVDANLKEIPNTEFEIEADMVILALGFLRPDIKGKKFVAGDMRRGPSLIVWALYEGRETARAINRYLQAKK